MTRPEHVTIQRMLGLLHVDLLLENQCWFAGGTAIVMQNGEYRLSRDIDFLCASQSGYRTLRTSVTQRGAAGLFHGPVTAERDFRCDQYGLRALLRFEDHKIKFEIVREARIELSGALDPELGCPILCRDDQFAEKLLANADRGLDPSSDYRDAIDRGMLALGTAGGIPDHAVTKSVEAYGTDVWCKLRQVTDYLGERPVALDRASDNLSMDPGQTKAAIEAVRREVSRLDPDPAGSPHGASAPPPVKSS